MMFQILHRSLVNTVDNMKTLHDDKHDINVVNVRLYIVRAARLTKIAICFCLQLSIAFCEKQQTAETYV